MNKGELIAAFADVENTTKKFSEEVINAFLNFITDTLAKGEKISLIGFGHFEVRERAIRKGRNPKTGEEMNILASKTVEFKPSKNLRERLNRGK